MITLGINAAFHDCSAALVGDGRVIAASEEERFSHVKHGKRPVPFTVWQLPFHAIDDCLRQAGITLRDVDHFAYSFRPDLLPTGSSEDQSSEVVALPTAAQDHARLPATIALPLEPSRHPSAGDGESPWSPLTLAYIVNAPRQLAGGAPHHLRSRFLNVDYDHVAARWHFVEHHLAHEASAFLAAPFQHCAVLTIDGRGERATTSCGLFDGKSYRRLRQVNVPHSLGLLYEQVTDYLGFLHSSDEYKVMALGSFGDPIYADLFRTTIRHDGKGGFYVKAPDLVAMFGPARSRGAPLEPRHLNIAASMQLVLEESVLQLASWLHHVTGLPDLAMAGGVALNCVMNARLRDEGPFSQVWVQPAAGDAGTALGAALWIDWSERAKKGKASREWVMQDAYLGPAFDDETIEQFLRWSKISYRRLDDVAGATAQMLAENRIIGWFQGRMEFGPRALGARSILASPLNAETQTRLNEIKDREDFRPVAPVVLEEKAPEWFVCRKTRQRARVNAPAVSERGDGFPAPFMLFTFDVRPERASAIPAVLHVDGTARVQTIRRDQNPLYYDLLAAFDRKTQVPILVNTSFNTRGQPIVCTPRDALESFFTSPLDALVIGSFVVQKDRLP